MGGTWRGRVGGGWGGYVQILREEKFLIWGGSKRKKRGSHEKAFAGGS